jgi:hypothetical protein
MTSTLDLRFVLFVVAFVLSLGVWLLSLSALIYFYLKGRSE